MELNKAFGRALKLARQKAGLTQEDFSTISSRTYLSSLERGIQSPTLEKLAQICEVLEVHPLTLLAAAYLAKDDANQAELLEMLRGQLGALAP